MSNIAREYIAVIHKDKDSDYGVTFPDFLGCITAGKTLEEAKNMASEALQFHIDGMIEDKEELPNASSLDDIKANYPDAELFLVITARIPAQAKRINITIDEAVLRKLDKILAEKGDNRSHFFTQYAQKTVAKFY